MPSIGAFNSLLGSQWGAASDSNYNTSSGLVLDADNKRIAIAFWVTQTMSISEVDLNLTASGTLTGINLRIRIESDSGSTTPSGTILGSGNAITSSFTVSSTGFQGLKTLSSPTGDIAPNTLIWIILYRQDGNSLSTTNKVSSRGPNNFQAPAVLIFNGTSYTSGFNPGNSCHILKSTTGELFGNPWTSNFNSGVSIQGSTVAGIKYRAAAKNILRGVVLNVQRINNPGNMVVKVYQNSAEKRSVTTSGASNFVDTTIYFDPVEIAANSDLYVILSSPSSGGSDSYKFFGANYDSNHKGAIFSSGTAYVSGTSSDPTALTVSSTFWPRFYVMFTSSDTDFTATTERSSVFLV